MVFKRQLLLEKSHQLERLRENAKRSSKLIESLKRKREQCAAFEKERLKRIAKLNEKLALKRTSLYKVVDRLKTLLFDYIFPIRKLETVPTPSSPVADSLAEACFTTFSNGRWEVIREDRPSSVYYQVNFAFIRYELY